MHYNLIPGIAEWQSQHMHTQARAPCVTSTHTQAQALLCTILSLAMQQINMTTQRIQNGNNEKSQQLA